jgi:hypothetical protein
MGIADPSIEQIYQSLGRELLSQVEGDLEGRILLFAAVKDGAGTISIFGTKSGASTVHLRLANRKLKNLVYDLWRRWRVQPNNQEWRVMCFVLDGANFSIDLTYPDQIESSPDDVIVPDGYRNREVRRYFAGVEVDFSGQ